MTMTINFKNELNIERLEVALWKKQSLSLAYPYKVRKSRLKCVDIGVAC